MFSLTIFWRMDGCREEGEGGMERERAIIPKEDVTFRTQTIMLNTVIHKRVNDTSLSEEIAAI